MVFVLVDVLAKFAKFGDHTGDTVGLLFSRVSDPSDGSRACEQRGERGEREKGVGEFGKILSDAPKNGAGPNRDVDVAVEGSDLGTEAREDVEKLGIALEAVGGRE